MPQSPTGASIVPESGEISWTLSETGLFEFTVQVNDGNGGIDTQSYGVEVTDSASGGNNQPVITSLPILEAEAGQLYEYQVRANDPDGDPLTYSLNQAPDGMAIDAGSGLLSYTPSLSNTGNDPEIEILVSDGISGGVSQRYTLTIVERIVNQAPMITSTPVVEVGPGEAYEYEVEAMDPDGDPLAYTLNSFPVGMEIDEFGAITWQPTDRGEFSVELEVSDQKGGSVTQAFSIEVGRDTEAPQVQLGFSGTVFDLGEAIELQIAATDNIGLVSLDLSVDGTSLPLNPNLVQNGVVNSASITPNTLGVFNVVATAADLAGNIDTETVEVRVIDPNDTTAPTTMLDRAQFEESGTLLTTPVNIVGTVNDENLEFYRLEIAPTNLVDLNQPAAADSDYIVLAEGNSNISNDLIGQVDPRLLANGSYFLRLITGALVL